MLVALRSSSFRALSDLLLLCKKRPPKVGGVLAGGLSYVGNRYPSLQVALQNRFGQIFCIRLCSNTLAATLSSSFYERHPDAIAFGQLFEIGKRFGLSQHFRQALFGAVQCEDFRGNRRRIAPICLAWSHFLGIRFRISVRASKAISQDLSMNSSPCGVELISFLISN